MLVKAKDSGKPHRPIPGLMRSRNNEACSWMVYFKKVGDHTYKRTIIRIETNTLSTLKVAPTSRGHKRTDEVAITT